MPGIVGTCAFENSNFEKAINDIVYSDDYIIDDKYNDDDVTIQRTHLGVIGEKYSPYIEEDILIWIEGEVYNLNEIDSKYDNTKFYRIIYDYYSKGILKDLLNKIDGYFSAVIYDKKKRHILLISDRYGLKPIYYGIGNNNKFKWSSELKSFKYLDNDLTIDTNSINDFIQLGHLLGDSTLFNEVKTLDSSSILKFEIDTTTYKITNYWSWSEIKKQNISFSHSVDKLNHLMRDSVLSRLSIENKIGLTLSGGVDSRYLLSLISDNNLNIPTVTFGQKNSIDKVIAKKVTDKLNNDATFLDLDSNRWFDSREESVWKTDGMFNLMHMHFSRFHKQISQKFRINMNGFAGDLNVGGGWIINNNQRINEQSARVRFPNVKVLPKLHSDFFNINHEDPYFIDTRVKRFTNMGSIEFSKLVEQRKPFFANSLMNFLYSIPDEYRKDGKLYYATIKKHSPNLFKYIHTTHGVIPIIGDSLQSLIVRKINNLLYKLKIKEEPKWSYHDYNTWFNEGSFVKYYKEMVFPKSSITKDLIGELELQKKFEAQINNKSNNTEYLLAVLTLEVFFRKFYDDK